MPAGGARIGAGRKPKADELELIEKLSPLDNQAFAALEVGLNEGDYNFVKLFMEYRYGKPKQQVQLSGDAENPLLAPPTVNVYNTLPPLSRSEADVDAD